jgi:nitrogen fixation protein FixH
MNYKYLIAVIAFVAFGIAGTLVWFAYQYREDTVVEHPYQEALQYEATQKKREQLGWQVLLPETLKQGSELLVQVVDKNGVPVDNAAVELSANRIDKTDTKKYSAKPADHGRYGARVDFTSHGTWEIKIKVTRGTDSLSFDNRIYIEK